jgi:hypothetical protein
MSLSRWRLRVKMANDASYMGTQTPFTRPLIGSALLANEYRLTRTARAKAP